MSKMTAQVPVAIAVGTHNWRQDDIPRLEKLVALLQKNDIIALDTARLYGGGASEQVIGRLNLASSFAIDTKAPTGFIDGAASKIYELATESKSVLHTNRIRTYFLHGPDETVPFEQQMKSIQRLYTEGWFDRFGVSNFSCAQFRRLYDCALAKGYILPTVFQSSYSLAVRGHEAELFPILRDLGVSIQAYSPIAAGLLAKTPEYIQQGKGSWNPKTPSGALYQHQYNKPSYMKMLREFCELSKESGISQTGLAYRWLRYHSFLQGGCGDEMIIGAANVDQLAETLGELEKGALEPWVVDRVEKFWCLIKDDAPVSNFESTQQLRRK